MQQLTQALFQSP